MIGVRSSGMQDLAALAVVIPKVATAVSIPLQIFWAGKILRFGLTSRYRALLAYLLTIPLFSIAFLAGIYWLDPDTRSFRLFYGWLFAVFAPVNAILLFCVLVETARAMFRDYSGLQRLAQLGIYAASVAVVGILLSMTMMDTSVATWTRFWRDQERSVSMALTLLCLLLVSIGTLFRLDLSRNVKIIFLSFGLGFAANASFGLLSRYSGALGFNPRDILVPIASAAGFAIGAVGFSKAGAAGLDPRPVLPVDARLEAQAGSVLRDFKNLLLGLLRPP